MPVLCKCRGVASVAVAALVLLACGSRDAAAITAQDVTEKMSHDQRFGYLTGLIDMTMYQTALSGNRTRAQCIYDAFYTKNAAQDDPWRRLNDALREFGDKRPESIVVLLIQKICGA